MEDSLEESFTEKSRISGNTFPPINMLPGLANEAFKAELEASRSREEEREKSEYAKALQEGRDACRKLLQLSDFNPSSSSGDECERRMYEDDSLLCDGLDDTVASNWGFKIPDEVIVIRESSPIESRRLDGPNSLLNMDDEDLMNTSASESKTMKRSVSMNVKSSTRGATIVSLEDIDLSPIKKSEQNSPGHIAAKWSTALHRCKSLYPNFSSPISVKRRRID